MDAHGQMDVVVDRAGIVFDINMYTATITEFENTFKVNIMKSLLSHEKLLGIC